jgi:hypothetical protein
MPMIPLSKVTKERWNGFTWIVFVFLLLVSAWLVNLVTGWWGDAFFFVKRGTDAVASIPRDVPITGGRSAKAAASAATGATIFTWLMILPALAFTIPLALGGLVGLSKLVHGDDE